MHNAYLCFSDIRNSFSDRLADNLPPSPMQIRPAHHWWWKEEFGLGGRKAGNSKLWWRLTSSVVCLPACLSASLPRPFWSGSRWHLLIRLTAAAEWRKEKEREKEGGPFAKSQFGCTPLASRLQRMDNNYYTFKPKAFSFTLQQMCTCTSWKIAKHVWTFSKPSQSSC